MMEWDILLHGGLVLPRADGTPFRGFVAIRGEKIAAVGPLADLPTDTGATRVIDADGLLLMPGLVNAHTHAAMTLFRGLADDLPLMTWLQEHIFPAEARWVSEEMVYWCSRLAAAEMLLSGTTTVADGYFFETAAARAFTECGLRAVAAQGVIDFPAPGVADPRDNLAVAEQFLQQWRNDPLITPAIFCHSIYTCGPQTLRRSHELARRYDVPWFIHIAETAAEVAECRKKHGKSPMHLLHNLGVLDEQTVCVHGVHLDRQDIALLRQSGAGMVTCPESNMKLASGTAPLAAMTGIPVALGTDGPASNNDLDLFREMDCCAKLHKIVTSDPTALTAGEALKMATSGGARVLGLTENIGALTAGRKADIIGIDLGQPHLTPFYGKDILVYAARGADVCLVLVNGRIVVRDRRLLTINLKETMARVRRLAGRLVEATGGSVIP